ncbi:uncharacterized protein PV07_04697 [Cladophialophora immunda]|uniref:Uncharacterized protein n=1 Tax=Cladophialophora immunda TaxID=569365 RepID=A0A0D1ZLI5_9EURO|nr:uncharacterized protein PV07_04697 [Cladophialophora immunda]KIW28831.1 hypothetical protein PV07_04697 [Cladophialophora immunda]
MILASSSGDHLDCFFAGDWIGWSWVEESLFAGTADRGWGGGRGATLVATLDGTDSDRDTEAGELVDWPSSSSADLSSDEISTMGDEMRCRFVKDGEGVVAGGQCALPYTKRRQGQREVEEGFFLEIRLRKRAQASTEDY